MANFDGGVRPEACVPPRTVRNQFGEVRPSSSDLSVVAFADAELSAYALRITVRARGERLEPIMLPHHFHLSLRSRSRPYARVTSA